MVRGMSCSCTKAPHRRYFHAAHALKIFARWLTEYVSLLAVKAGRRMSSPYAWTTDNFPIGESSLRAVLLRRERKAHL